jgi:hypothetical protein
MRLRGRIVGGFRTLRITGSATALGVTVAMLAFAPVGRGSGTQEKVASRAISSVHGASDTTVSCANLGDAYDDPPNLLTSCGDTVYPMVSSGNYSDGGTWRTYALTAGHTVTLSTPPAGFSPLTASPAQLEQYSIPEPPPSSAPESEQVQWASLMAAATTPAPPVPFLIGLPLQSVGAIQAS